MNIHQSLSLLEQNLKKELAHLEEKLKGRKERRCYVCNTCSLEVFFTVVPYLLVCTSFRTDFMAQPEIKTVMMEKLEWLNIAFRTQDNNLFQFNNADHSFTLEVTEVVDMPESSGVSSRRGK